MNLIKRFLYKRKARYIEELREWADISRGAANNYEKIANREARKLKMMECV